MFVAHLIRISITSIIVIFTSLHAIPIMILLLLQITRKYISVTLTISHSSKWCSCVKLTTSNYQCWIFTLVHLFIFFCDKRLQLCTLCRIGGLRKQYACIFNAEFSSAAIWFIIAIMNGIYYLFIVNNCNVISVICFSYLSNISNTVYQFVITVIIPINLIALVDNFVAKLPCTLK